MADRDTKQPTHKAFTVIKREGKEDYWVYVSMLATTVDDLEPQLLTQEIACDTVATIEDALAVIRQAIEKV